MKEEKSGQRYRVNPLRFLAGFMFRTALLCLLFLMFLWVSKGVAVWLSLVSGLYWLPELLTFPWNVLITAAIALFWTLCGVKTVRVEQGTVCIKRLWRKERSYRIGLYHFDSCVETGRILGNRRLFLEIWDDGDTLIKEELFFYSPDTYTALIAAVNAAVTESLPKEIRNAVEYADGMQGEVVYRFPYEKVRKNEWQRLLLFSVIVAGCFAVLLLFSFWIKDWRLYFVTALAGVMVLSIPVEAVRVVCNIARCPRLIKRDGQFFFFDGECFSVDRVERLVMTDPKAVGSSIYPKNRYIRVYDEKGKHRYWMGSTYSMGKQSYEDFCCELEEMFINHAAKVVYDQK